jgi:SAM-dependent methyltransferase
MWINLGIMTVTLVFGLILLVLANRYFLLNTRVWNVINKITRGFDLTRMVFLENSFPHRVERVSEPSVVMDSDDQVRAWDQQGEPHGPIDPVYHFVARAVSALCPKNGLVVDLGCGSGRFLTHLATIRPDIKGIGIDLSSPMVAAGNKQLRENGLSSRVVLQEGDITNFATEDIPQVNVIVSLFSLHHLPIPALRDAALMAISTVERRTGASVFLFDLVRPHREGTISLYPTVFSPNCPESFRLDSVNSLRAAWTFEELMEPVLLNFGPKSRSAIARYLPLYQAHWKPAQGMIPSSSIKFSLEEENLQRFHALRKLFPDVPLSPETSLGTIGNNYMKENVVHPAPQIPTKRQEIEPVVREYVSGKPSR